MTITEAEYFNIRSTLLREDQGAILAIEQRYMDFLTRVTVAAADSIFQDFSQVTELLPFWINYPPIQRGRGPIGDAIPWGEVGEKPISANLVRVISQMDPAVSYPGLPLGGDVRFATADALIHLDMKLTGPRDNANEVVASPHQISGDGNRWNNGVINSAVVVTGQRATMNFQPELPPFYKLGERILPCLTYFLKAVYTVRSLGDQPLDYLELACVPNGLLLFDGPRYANRVGLLIPGKDQRDHPKKRARVRLDPLAQLASWRCAKIVRTSTGWSTTSRLVPPQLGLVQ